MKPTLTRLSMASAVDSSTLQEVFREGSQLKNRRELLAGGKVNTWSHPLYYR